MIRKFLSVIAGLVFLTSGIYSQDYQIRIIYKGGGVIGVEMRVVSGTPPTTSDFLTDIVVGIKWNITVDADLSNTITTAFNIKKAGVRNSKSGYFFQAFYCDPVGFNFPAAWTLNEWVEIISIAINQTGSGTGLFQICESGFDVTTDPNFGVNFIDFTPLIIGGPVDAPLPVTMTRFEATPEKSYIHLSWTTVTESNNKGFEIQRAQMEASNFTAIGWVDGAGNSVSVQNYVFKDVDVTGGIKYYYRLKQIDFDERETFSNTRFAQLDTKNSFLLIYPNPASEKIQIVFLRDLPSETIWLQVISAEGKKIKELKTPVSAGLKVEIPVSGLANGQYFLVATDGNKVIYKEGFQKL